MVDHPALNLASLDTFLPNPLSVDSTALMWSAALISEFPFLFKSSNPDIELLSLEWNVTLGLSIVN
jgi:hypothetical protein